MKPYYLLFLLFPFFITSCKKENQEPFVPKNYLADFKTEKTQAFDLNTLDFKKIIGKHGTEIFYDRELFQVKQNEKVQLELIELYDFKDILYRNIQTLTTDNELLETSGVLRIVFTSNGKKLNLRKGEKIIVHPPKGKLKDNDIFLSETDSIGAIKWKVTNTNYVSVKVDRGGGISVIHTMLKDSLPSFQKKMSDRINFEKKAKNYFILNDNSWNWINIDKLSNIKKLLIFN
jgi:hypothetical protein